MNNRFKFRVFNKLWDCYSMDDFYIDEDGDLNILGSEYVVEQCTGLKDKNGNLIYEGDILKTLDGSICYVIWMEISFWVESPGSEAKDLEHNSFYEHCEVIGNIHENKELLDEN